MACKRRAVDTRRIHTANGTEYNNLRTQSPSLQTPSKLLPHLRPLPQPALHQPNRHPQLLPYPHRRHQRQSQSHKPRLPPLIPPSRIHRRRPRQSHRPITPRPRSNLHPQTLRLLPPTSRELHPKSKRLLRIRLRPLRRPPLRFASNPPQRENRIRSLPLRLPPRRRRISQTCSVSDKGRVQRKRGNGR